MPSTSNERIYGRENYSCNDISGDRVRVRIFIWLLIRISVRIRVRVRLTLALVLTLTFVTGTNVIHSMFYFIMRQQYVIAVTTHNCNYFLIPRIRLS